MPAMRKKKKISRKQRQKFLNIAIPASVILISFLLGSGVTLLMQRRAIPDNIVWAADSTVKLPPDLKKFLEKQNKCEQYRGNSSPKGVGLWGVYQMSGRNYAKISYGCSWGLTTYIMAVKQNSEWRLIEPTVYFAPFKDGVNASNGALPYCAQLELYKIPKDIESFCISHDGTAKSNDI